MPRGLTDFGGIWRLEREIEDHLGGGRARMYGTCAFRPDGTGLDVEERGLLHMPDAARPFEAARRYLWREEGRRIDVFFADGGYFHSFAPEEAQPEAGHDCAPDRYDVRYDFSLWPDWHARWRVRGPRKDYLSVTRFSREGA
ncbi:DUF6314 family protein [Celeribacter indicus]|uniref:DUF6314 domain-containing protein n=1 Tax=Celeribacter indicus TaxID=1208324 RepID=A0A0B5DYU4_9RHOB|nr:DUF6314 family protein [Celeribacter indicus]AJE46355.1 hypothetical protein P73_1640 [Celeribacter indicus]SDW54367.1 hypothetical protein SAMN05443573_104192 [Celeribacter indicus]